ncbi:MAG: hypothetical protein Q7S92_01115 [Candidatus Diapherotrites archaeon]|nr:hypothetical protein [Candidatus Diapherotrites archaeon]
MAQLKRKVTLVFFFLYAIFGIILMYLFFFNLGLTFERQIIEGQPIIVLKNNSLHLIRDINLLDSKGESKLSLAQLLPGEQSVVDLSLFSGNKISATAPFHSSAEIVLAQGGNISNLTAPKLAYNSTYPVPAIVSQLFPVSFDVCNSGQQSADVVLSFAFDVQFFSSSSIEQTVTIAGSECKNLSFQFMPLKAGDSSIRFVLQYGDTRENIPVSIQIVGT